MGVLAENWWMATIRGIAAILFGIAAIVWPGITLTIFLSLFGIFMLLEGLFALASAVRAARDQSRWWSLVVEGIIAIIIGIAAFSTPEITTVFIIYFVAAWAMLAGIFRVIAAIELRKEISGEWLYGASGIISLIFGVIILSNPIAGALAIMAVIGFFAVIFGIMTFAFSFRLRDWQKKKPEKMKRAA